MTVSRLRPPQGQWEVRSKGPGQAESLWEEGSTQPGLASHGRVWWPPGTLLLSETGWLKYPLLTVIFQDMMTDLKKKM